MPEPRLRLRRLRRQEVADVFPQRQLDQFFFDLFGRRPVEGLDAVSVKRYIRYIADRRLVQLGLNQLYHVPKNPLPWLDDMLNAVEHTNFFENRATEYSKASTSGSWEEAFASP